MAVNAPMLAMLPQRYGVACRRVRSLLLNGAAMCAMPSCHTLLLREDGRSKIRYCRWSAQPARQRQADTSAKVGDTRARLCCHMLRIRLQLRTRYRYTRRAACYAAVKILYGLRAVVTLRRAPWRANKYVTSAVVAIAPCCRGGWYAATRIEGEPYYGAPRYVAVLENIISFPSNSHFIYWIHTSSVINACRRI